MRILTEPRNAITQAVRQVARRWTRSSWSSPRDALEAAAERALQLKTGARGLRTIIEEVLLEVMYEIPSRADVRKCIIGRETIAHGQAPLLVTTRSAAAHRRAGRDDRVSAIRPSAKRQQPIDQRAVRQPRERRHARARCRRPSGSAAAVSSSTDQRTPSVNATHEPDHQADRAQDELRRRGLLRCARRA